MKVLDICNRCPYFKMKHGKVKLSNTIQFYCASGSGFYVDIEDNFKIALTDRCKYKMEIEILRNGTKAEDTYKEIYFASHWRE